jgi:surface protein
MFGYSDLSGMDKLDLSHFNVSNVNRMSGMFAFCKAKNIDLHGWNIQHNCNLEVMFINSEVETLNLNDWQLSSTWDNTSGMLQGCAKLQTLYCPQSITSYAVDLPKTMYDSNGNSYTTLPGGNITLYATNPAA